MPVKTTIVPLSIWKTLAYLHICIPDALYQLMCFLVSAMLAGIKDDCLVETNQGSRSLSYSVLQAEDQAQSMHLEFTEG